ncbi:ArnT family glycosyltransferase [Spirosoma sp. KUDC1026]|uniref:ArnT family glycosyltransferase n=1 Tax=Spirosoma sp. KUDC1026 TaxID=2745947 RepID=UPI00159BD88A|nr:glycosyltransferase family 39 protein [Spirosoma sp. KUDC1026]QKZ11233.1 glycosyltransferase family 39 protein [Spirosoma sp. KUDC1026]
MKTFSVAFFILFVALLLTCYHRTEHFDDAWFAEQSYWLVRDGWVRSELFRGLNGWEDRIYVFHKLFIYAGALVMKLFGFSLPASKLLTTFCALIAGYLIWVYNQRASKKQQLLALILYFGCGAIIRYFSINRPEIMCMLFGLGSYLALDRPNNKPSNVLLAGCLAGLAALTHLNGIIYLVAGAGWLLVKTNWRAVIWFSLFGGLTLSIYGLDALADNQFNAMLDQFVNDPATQSNFKLIDKLYVMLNYHQLFFHSHGEVPLSVLVLLCVLIFRRALSLSQSVPLYLTLLIVAFWLLTKSNFDFYYILFVPWFVLLASQCLTVYLPDSPVWQQRAGTGVLIIYYGFALFSIGKVLEENYTTRYVPAYNNTLAQHMPDRQTKVIAPISFFFGQIENYRIHGLSYYSAKHETASLEEFFRLAAQENAKYVVSDGYKTASYVIPLDVPDRIGTYQLIFRDDMTSIYERQP